MSEPVDNRIRRLITLYDRGTITKTELSWGISQSATDPHFFEHIDLVPRELMPQLREIAEHAQAHPEDCLMIHSICTRPGFDYEAYDREQRETAYWSARRLREHFYPDRPMPEFEPLKLAGLVDDSREKDGSVVIFGDIHSHLIRRNPIHLIAPNGSRIITSATGMGFIKDDRDLNSSDPITRQYGRHGVYLDDNVKSTSDTPPGTEVWVDRTAVAELPDPPSI